MATQTQKKLMGKEKLLDIMAARVFAYSFLSRSLWDEPSKEFLKILTDDDVLAAFPNPDDNALIKEGCENISFSLRDPSLLTDEGVLDLIGEFNRVFIGSIKRGDAVSPYESVYRSPDKLVFQQITMDVRAAYAKYDLKPERMQQEPDDHIGLELQFMQMLCEKCLKDLRANRFHRAKRMLRDQKSFLEDHLLKWAPELGGKIVVKAKSDFYRGVGRILSGFLAVEKELVDSLLEEVSERLKRHKQEKEMKSV